MRDLIANEVLVYHPTEGWKRMSLEQWRKAIVVWSEEMLSTKRDRRSAHYPLPKSCA